MAGEAGRALPQTCCPTVWIWAGQALYAGAALDLSPHSGSVFCLAVGIDRPFTLRVGDDIREFRSALIPPRTVHQLISHQGRMIFCYLDPASERARSCGEWMKNRAGTVGFEHAAEDRLLTLGADLLDLDGKARAETPDAGAENWLQHAAPVSAHRIDPRIAEATRAVRADPAGALSARELARQAQLSESRFLHLFRQETGTSLRRYRLWMRLVHAATLFGPGADLTTVAADAGFASPSHLSDRFRSTFGLPATKLLATGVRLRPRLDLAD